MEVMVAFIIVSLVIPFAVIPLYYSNTVYQADAAKEWLWRATLSWRETSGAR